MATLLSSIAFSKKNHTSQNAYCVAQFQCIAFSLYRLPTSPLCLHISMSIFSFIYESFSCFQSKILTRDTIEGISRFTKAYYSWLFLILLLCTYINSKIFSCSLLFVHCVRFVLFVEIEYTCIP